MSTYATVTPIPPVPSVEALTYHVPHELERAIAAGMRVLVPLGRRRVTGIVTALEDAPPARVACRDIGAVLDLEPVLSDELLGLARWMSDYYLAPFAEVLSLAVGRGLTSSSKRLVRLLDATLAGTAAERRLVESLARAGGVLDSGRLRRELGGRSIDGTLTALAARGAVRIEEELAPPKVRERRETFAEIAASADENVAATLFARAPKRKQIYEHLLDQPDRRLSLRRLAESFPSPAAQIDALEAAGLVRRFEREVYRELQVAAEGAERHELSSHQGGAVDEISGALGGFVPFLLQGVTSSGKTEVYLRVIERVLDGRGSALVLVPEISLTHQVVARLVGRFGPTVAILHSELSAGERWDQWRRICRRQARIAVGARSAVLAPLHDLAVIVVDEEHDPAYKQADGVRYNGRDVAIMRARRVGCPIVLGSATPSIETRRHAFDERYRRIVLPERVTASPLPSVEVVDLRGRDIVATGGLSEHLADLVRKGHEKGEQTLLFLNRRGYASNLQCYGCGEIVECSACSVGMTLHGQQRLLICHHCDATRPAPARCPGCGADALLSQGLGTQRLEATVRAMLPEARVERLDRDAASRKGRSQELLARWRAGGIDVLIGTQMVTKGHDAPGVTLVGVVHADLALGVPDFRAAERTFQLLSQVAGRAGRGERRGRVIFQTYRPDHFAVAAAVRHDYEAFAARELAERHELCYPPFTRMVLLRFEGPTGDAVEQVASSAARVLSRLAQEVRAGERGCELVVRGPAPAPIERVKGRYRFQVQIRCEDGALARHAAAECRRLLADGARQRDVRMLVDIDPVDML